MLTKKTSLLALFVACAPFALADDHDVKSRVYPWADAKVEETRSGQVREILEGTTNDVKELDIKAVTVEPGKSRHVDKTHEDEELVILKSGQLDITIGGETKTLGPGSVAVLFPGDLHSITNNSDAPATYFLFEYESVGGSDSERAEKAGGSFSVNFDDVEYMPSDIGGRRDIYDRPSAMFSTIEMHVSTLKPQITNHQAHIHGNDEMVLVIKGEVEMLVGENYYKGKSGDLYFLHSKVPHSLRNIGDEPTEYYAFHWR